MPFALPQALVQNHFDPFLLRLQVLQRAHQLLYLPLLLHTLLDFIDRFLFRLVDLVVILLKELAKPDQALLEVKVLLL